MREACSGQSHTVLMPAEVRQGTNKGQLANTLRGHMLRTVSGVKRTGHSRSWIGTRHF